MFYDFGEKVKKQFFQGNVDPYFNWEEIVMNEKKNERFSPLLIISTAFFILLMINVAIEIGKQIAELDYNVDIIKKIAKKYDDDYFKNNSNVLTRFDFDTRNYLLILKGKNRFKENIKIIFEITSRGVPQTLRKYKNKTLVYQHSWRDYWKNLKNGDIYAEW